MQLMSGIPNEAFLILLAMWVPNWTLYPLLNYVIKVHNNFNFKAKAKSNEPNWFILHPLLTYILISIVQASLIYYLSVFWVAIFIVFKVDWKFLQPDAYFNISFGLILILDFFLNVGFSEPKLPLFWKRIGIIGIINFTVSLIFIGIANSLLGWIPESEIAGEVLGLIIINTVFFIFVGLTAKYNERYGTLNKIGKMFEWLYDPDMTGVMTKSQFDAYRKSKRESEKTKRDNS